MTKYKEDTYSKIKKEIVLSFESAMEDIAHSYINDNSLAYKHVYHYTTTPVLLEILKHGIIHASNVQFMNDSQEVSHAKDMIERIYTENFLNTNDEFNLIERMNMFYNVKNVFVVSLSKKDDTLPLWYNYASGDGCNFALSFDRLFNITKTYNPDVLLSKTYKGGKYVDAKERLIELASNPYTGLYYLEYETSPFWWFAMAPVIYEYEKQEKIIINIFKTYNQLICDPRYEYYIGTINNFLSLSLKRCSVFFKNDSFSSEEEIRLCLFIRQPFMENVVEYKAYHGTFIPYIKLNIKNLSGVTSNNKMIESITLGPRVKSDFSKEGIEYYLLCNGFDNVPVNISKAPLRF